MATESGDMKLLGNFRQLIDHVSAEADYKPANNDLKPTALEAQYTAALAATQDVPAKMAAYKSSLNDRQSTYDDLDPVVMRARNMLKASGADQSTLDNAETHVRKLLGRRKSKPKSAAANPADGAGPPATETAGTHSASQLSFENRAGNLDAFIEVLAGVSDYKPNEADLKVTALRALSNDLKTKNNAVSVADAYPTGGGSMLRGGGRPPIVAGQRFTAAGDAFIRAAGSCTIAPFHCTDAGACCATEVPIHGISQKHLQCFADRKEE